MQELKSGKALIRIRYAGYGIYKHLIQDNRIWNRPSSVLIDFSKCNYNKDYEIPITTTLPEEAKLIFHKTSKFPRHKLEITSYKRKIKESLADYMVGNYQKFNPSVNSSTYFKAFVSKDKIYVIQDSQITLDEIHKAFPEIQGTITETINDFKLLSLTKEELLYLEYMEGEHTKPIISDKDLNKLVDKKSDRLTEQDIESIVELLKSKDEENINLGAKLLTQFNLSATPCLTSLFLMTYHKYIQYSSARTSVVYKNLISEFPPILETEYNIKQIINKYGFVDEEEKLLCRKLMIDKLLPDVEFSINSRNTLLEKFGVKIKYEVVDA